MLDETRLKKDALKAVYKSEYSKYQTIRRRLAASIIDSLVLAPLNFAVLGLLLAVYREPSSYFLLNVISSVLLAGYNIALIYYFGATVGKMVMGLEVVHAIGEAKISLSQSVFRESMNIGVLFFSIYTAYSILSMGDNVLMAKIASGKSADDMYSSFTLWSSWVVLAGLATSFFNKKKRGIHDYFGSTVVVIKRDRIRKGIVTILLILSVAGAVLYMAAFFEFTRLISQKFLL